LTATAIPAYRSVLAEALLPQEATRTGLTVILGTILTAFAAQFAFPIPGSPVPVTGQTFAVLVTAAALGPARGLVSQGLYVALGAVGLPVFTNGAHGVQIIAGPTGGYLIGFLAAALIVGAASRRGSDRSPIRTLAVLVVASGVIYLLGATWLAIVTGMTASQALAAGVTPFLFGDLLKVGLAAGLLPTAWRLVRRLDPTGELR
jgi:biotin transport system substrate-specific component